MHEEFILLQNVVARGKLIQQADIILKYFEIANNSGYVVYTSLTVCSILYVDMCNISQLTRPTLVSSPLWKAKLWGLKHKRVT